MEIPEIKHTPTTSIEFTKWQVIQYNKTIREAKGFVCNACKNRRWFAFVNSNGEFALKACTCQNVIAAKREEENRKGEQG